MSPDLSVERPPKAIPPARDRLQSRLLVWIVTPLLLTRLLAVLPSAYIDIDVYLTLRGNPYAVPRMFSRYMLQALAVSLTFALLAWLVRAATPAAAAIGGLVCLSLTGLGLVYGLRLTLLHSPLRALVLLFVLTSLATRFRRARKEIAGTAEARTGRRASQVVANLGVASLCGLLSNTHFRVPFAPIYLAAIAALAEATADTLSSEIGQGVAGPAFLISNLRRVPPGTDGAISFAGTLAGLVGAAAVILVGLPHPFGSMTPLLFAAVLVAAIAGLFFDSLLGATLERRGWIGNDLVNFLSTAFAAAASYPLMLLALRFRRA